MEHQFKVNESDRPMFINADTYESALEQLTLIGYTIKVDDFIIEPTGNIREQVSQDEIDEINRKNKEDRDSAVSLQIICDSCDNTQSEVNSSGKLVSLLNKFDFFGRSLLLCDSCLAKEKATLLTAKAESSITLQEKIEKIVAKRVNNKVEHWTELYNETRPSWTVDNFESLEVMRDSLVEFIVSLEQLTFDSKAKMRAAYDSARELEARLDKAGREKLIFDPNFKAPDNSEHKRMSREDKARADLVKMGMSEAMINEFLKGKS